MPKSKLELVRDAYEAFGRGDLPAALGILHPDVVWQEAEGFPYGGTYHGPDEVRDEVFTRLATEWEGFSAEPANFIEGESTVVALGEYGGTYRATGKSFRAPFAHVWRFESEKVVSFQQITDTVLIREALEEEG